jgi:Ni/Fe-hydrogenase subunit HybB-like protein
MDTVKLQGNAPSIPPTSGLGYASRPETKAPDWHHLVAWDLLFNNLATGLFLVAALGELTAPAAFRSLASVAYPIALALLLTDLLFLVLDLGDPWRFHHMLRVFKPSSPMSLGTWSLTLFSMPLTIIVATEVLPGEWVALQLVRKIAIVAGLLPALGSAVYKGVLLSTNAQPGWKDARWLGGYLANSALMLGCALLLALSALFDYERATAILRTGLALLVPLNAVLLGLLIADVRPALASLYTVPQRARLASMIFGLGMLIPGVLLLLAASAPILLGVLSLVLVGSMFVRFAIIRIPQAGQHRI